MAALKRPRSMREWPQGRKCVSRHRCRVTPHGLESIKVKRTDSSGGDKPVLRVRRSPMVTSAGALTAVLLL